MSQDEITRMAREAGLADCVSTGWPEELEHFAALVAAAEREACAYLRREVELRGKWPTEYEDGFWDGLEKYEELIRARNST